MSRWLKTKLSVSRIDIAAAMLIIEELHLAAKLELSPYQSGTFLNEYVGHGKVLLKGFTNGLLLTIQMTTWTIGHC